MYKSKLLSLLIVILLLMTGCSGAKEETRPTDATDVGYLQGLASLERNLLQELEPLSEDIRSYYAKWEKGEINRQEFNNLCNEEYIPRINEIKASYKDYIKKYPIPESLTKNPDFANGLNSGKLLRSDIGIFLVKVVKGNGILKELPADGQVDANDITFEYISDQDLVTHYDNFMVENFNIHYQQLEDSLAKYEKE